MFFMMCFHKTRWGCCTKIHSKTFTYISHSVIDFGDELMSCQHPWPFHQVLNGCIINRSALSCLLLDVFIDLGNGFVIGLLLISYISYLKSIRLIKLQSSLESFYRFLLLEKWSIAIRCCWYCTILPMSCVEKELYLVPVMISRRSFYSCIK